MTITSVYLLFWDTLTRHWCHPRTLGELYKVLETHNSKTAAHLGKVSLEAPLLLGGGSCHGDRQQTLTRGHEHQGAISTPESTSTAHAVSTVPPDGHANARRERISIRAAAAAAAALGVVGSEVGAGVGAKVDWAWGIQLMLLVMMLRMELVSQVEGPHAEGGGVARSRAAPREEMHSIRSLGDAQYWTVMGHSCGEIERSAKINDDVAHW